MKKLLALILALALTLSMTACGGGGDGESKENEESKEVELTADNIEEYLSLSLETSSVRANAIAGMNLGGTLQDITLSSYAVQGGSFNNVKITFEIPLPKIGDSYSLFEVAKTDEAYDENDEYTLTFTVRVPANGEFSEAHTVYSLLSKSLKDYDIEYTITEISGTFKPD